MKYLLYLLAVITPSIVNAERFYNPQDGRWLNRDPLGIEGGINLYNSVSNNMVNGYTGGLSLNAGMNEYVSLSETFGLDPYGDKALLIEILNPNDAGESKRLVELKKRYQEWIEYISGKRKGKVALDFALWDDLVKNNRVYWNNKPFKGTKKELIKLLERELESEVVTKMGSDKKFALNDLIKLYQSKTAKYSERYDNIGIALHGYHSNGKWTGNAKIGGKSVSQEKIRNELKKAVPMFRQNRQEYWLQTVLISCGLDSKIGSPISSGAQSVILYGSIEVETRKLEFGKCRVYKFNPIRIGKYISQKDKLVKVADPNLVK